jgi:diguanylate cyclase (GGDEF)-like protein
MKAIALTVRRPGALRRSAIGILMLAGGVIAALTVVLPPAATGSDPLVLVCGAVAAAIGTALLLVRRSISEEVVAGVAVLGTALITLATYEGGVDADGTADNEMLYVWVGLFAFYFFRLRYAFAELAVIGLAYGWLLSVADISADEAATRWVVTLGTLLVAGLLVARLRDSLEDLVIELTDRARLDDLTKTLNRTALEERAAVEFARLRRGGGAVAILVCDIDDFKTINDSLGHPAGDQVLRRVAAVFETETRDLDAVARVGGDEFAVLLPAVTAETARAIAERLRVAVRRAAGDMHLRLSLSIGVAVAPRFGSTLDELWKAADRAMYEAKRSGGDAVAEAGEPSLDPGATVLD